jgi:hypothetical protein
VPGRLLPLQSADLGELVSGAVAAVVGAQATLDADSLRRTSEWLEAGDGDVVPPPLWYSVTNVAVELHLSATVHAPTTGPSLRCRTVNPLTVGLFGYEAAAGVRVRLLVQRQGDVRPHRVEG